MAHPNVKESSSIVTILQPVLQLNSQQLELLEQLEYEWYRSYQFDVPKFHSSKVATMRGLRQFLPVLQREQIRKLKVVLQENRKEHNIYDQADMERRSIERLFHVLKFLKLRPAQEKLLNQLWEDKGYLRIDRCLEQLEPTLDLEQAAALKKYREKQARLFREGQENHVQFAFEYLALNEEQFQAVVDYHVKNYWRDGLPLVELKEEAELMRKILTETQWTAYSLSWEKQMNRAKELLEEQEEDNRFTLRWTKGLYAYTRDILYPIYLASRREFEKHLSSEERSLISQVREKVKEFYDGQLQKDNGDHSSTEMETDKIWVARAKLMPSVGTRKTKSLEEDLREIAKQHAQVLYAFYVTLEQADLEYREFTAKFYDEIGGIYGPNVMVYRDEEERARELWDMNFLLVDPTHTPG